MTQIIKEHLRTSSMSKQIVMKEIVQHVLLVQYRTHIHRCDLQWDFASRLGQQLHFNLAFRVQMKFILLKSVGRLSPNMIILFKENDPLSSLEVLEDGFNVLNIIYINLNYGVAIKY